jgi:hypothetical protein
MSYLSTRLQQLLSEALEQTNELKKKIKKGNGGWNASKYDDQC